MGAWLRRAQLGWAARHRRYDVSGRSISKPLAAMAALRMVQEGKLSLDGDGNTYLSSWRFPADPGAVGKSLTLRELLTLAAGTTVRAFPGYATNDAVRAV